VVVDVINVVMFEVFNGMFDYNYDIMGGIDVVLMYKIDFS